VNGAPGLSQAYQTKRTCHTDIDIQKTIGRILENVTTRTKLQQSTSADVSLRSAAAAGTAPIY
jgi:hypothetical protein